MARSRGPGTRQSHGTRARKTKDELLRGYAILRAVVEGTSDLVFVKDLDGHYLMVNPAMASFLGKAEQDIIGATDADLFPPETLQAIRTHDAAVLASGSPSTEEYSLEVAGVLRTHLVTKEPFRDATTGEITGIVGIASEITERKRAEQALRDSEARYRRLVESSPDGIWVHSGGITLFANRAMARILGARGPEDLVGRSVYDFVRLEEQAVARARVARVEEGGSVPFDLRELVRMDGTSVLTEVAVEPVVWEGQRAVQSVVRDVSQRMRAEEALRESEERYALAAAAANDGLWDWDLRSRKMYFAPRWSAQLGLAPEDVGSDPEEWFGRVHPDDVERLRAELTAHIAGASGHFESTYRIRHADGSWRWMQSRGLAVRGDDKRAYRLAGSQTDITERKLAEEQLIHDALHDSLTGLPNRALFLEELRMAIDRRRRRPEYGFTVLFLDLDRFKVVNDSLGHLAGDQLLVALSERLKSVLRPGDRVARLGGDEFTILCDDIDNVQDATRIAERIQQELEAPIDIGGGREIFTSASIGVALASTGYQDPEHVLRDADLAMYRAKGRGGARVEVFDLGMLASAMARLELETDLRRALERSEFRLFYQPIFAQSDTRIVGFEALLRWQHPRRGLVDPSAFIDVAEETNLTVLIGRWVLGEACRQLREWRDQYPQLQGLGVGVNISRKQLLAPNLPSDVSDAIRTNALAPRSLHLEITENVVMEDASNAAAALEALRVLGVRIHMDDFGTGYSSLSYLRRFPLHGLKIDRSFVSHMDEAANLELVRTIVTLGRNLGLRVVAEGVENAQQWVSLRAMGCDYVQGFLFSPPVDAEAAGRLLAGR
ncbi:MAG TPA: EAL domain-containing protein [Gemmatimonadales bacterium]|nr:EAL domain-containing protein [Gemmatimonadales bacterium]